MRRLLPAAVLLLAACSRTSPSSAPITATLSGSPSGTGAPPGIADAGAPPFVLAPAVAGRRGSVVGVTSDRKRALVCLVDSRESWVDPLFRWIDLATNAVVAEWHEPALMGLPRETMTDSQRVRSRPGVTDAALEADIVRHAAALLEVSARDERFAAAPDASVFNVGDWLYVADTRTGKVGVRLASDASYYPQISPNGAFVVYTREQGLLDGVVGNYMPFVAPLPAGAPSRRLEVKDIDGELMELSADGRNLYVQTGHEKPEAGCLVSVELAPPSRATSLFCVTPRERIDGVRFSPSRTLAVVMAQEGKTGPERAVWIHLPDGANLGELHLPHGFQIAAVTDAGVGLAGGASPIADESALVDPAARRFESVKIGVWLPYAFYGAAWVDPHRFVMAEGGGVRIVDLATAPHSLLPWP